MTAFAAFLIAKPQTGREYAATTRAADRGEQGKIGLPGGKVDPGETETAAVIRESAEEGWRVPANSVLTEVNRAIVEGQEVVWFSSNKPVRRMFDYKEKGRISPIIATLEDIACSGFGNEFLASDPWDQYCKDRFDL